MTDPLIVLSDLKAKFTQFDDIAEITRQLQQKLTQINKDNENAAGQDDSVAQAYHKQVNDPTKGLVDLVASIETMFGITSNNGSDVADTFTNAENNAQQTAQSW
jgi:iron-sulfur cluster repair protein YtfE (RIC family)